MVFALHVRPECLVPSLLTLFAGRGVITYAVVDHGVAGPEVQSNQKECSHVDNRPPGFGPGPSRWNCVGCLQHHYCWVKTFEILLNQRGLAICKLGPLASQDVKLISIQALH
jgi:hypothetical protein